MLQRCLPEAGEQRANADEEALEQQAEEVDIHGRTLTLATDSDRNEDIMTTYDVTLTQDGAWWMAAIPAFDGLTQGRTRDEAKEAAREYIAVTLDVPIEAVTVRVASDT